MEAKYSLPKGFKIVSGGQSGADRAGLDWAIAHGVAHGGWCPKGRKTEEGPLADHYQLQETPDSKYLQRTEWNVRDADATIIFTLSEKVDGGSKRTVEFAEKLGKPFLHFRPGVHPKFIARFLQKNQVRVLNIAGKRESSAPGIAKFVEEALSAALGLPAE
ncbi:MAG TPA: putative molybdenum carrier protein [Noviherbaspirillum sp.]|nr:putative molybdenum carrier protein [Noviherbaspirillum sp.]